MSYPNELCRLVLGNLALLEQAPSIISEIEAVLFTAINARLEQRVRALDGWDGVFDLAVDADSGETYFGPRDWLERNLYYALDGTEDDTEYWSTMAFAAFSARKARLCLQITPEPSRKKRKGLFARLSACTDVFQANGIEFDEKSGMFYVPIVLDLAAAVAAYPDIDALLGPVDQAFDRLLKGHEQYGRIAQGDLAYYDNCEEAD